MKDKVVYLVGGTAGSYSDRRDWEVAVFTKEERAEAFKTLLQEKVRQAYEAFRKADEERDDFPDRKEFAFAEDPKAEIQDDTQYAVVPLPFDPKFEV